MNFLNSLQPQGTITHQSKPKVKNHSEIMPTTQLESVIMRIYWYDRIIFDVRNQILTL